MAILLRTLGYTGLLESYTWPDNFGAVNANIWLYGGAGGGGGVDTTAFAAGRRAGNGAGGCFSYNEISLNPGDKISVAVGGGGGGGQSVAPGQALGGAAGRGLQHQVLTSLQLHEENPTRYPRVSLDGRWTNFLNTQGIWVSPDANPWEDVFEVEIPYTAWYTFEWSVDDTIIWRVDGQDINTESGGFRNIFATSVLITKGTHTIGWRAFNFRGPRGFAFRVYLSLAGGRGGNSGTEGGQNNAGGGGGAGGATVLLKNDEIIAVAAGGAGGGGLDDGDSANKDAPSTSGSVSGIRDYAGGDGQSLGSGNGAGSGGGSAGLRGGNGGSLSGVNGQAGTNGQIGGTNFGGTSTGLPPGKNSNFPAISDKYYSAYRARGGNGASLAPLRGRRGDSGVVWIEFDVRAPAIKHNDVWNEIKATWIRESNRWTTADTLVKIDGEWQRFFTTNRYLFFEGKINSMGNDFTRPFGRIDVQPINTGPF